MQQQTLSSLPTELIHTIISLLENQSSVLACSLTSRRIREVAVEFIFRELQVWIKDLETVDHAIRFLEQNPRAAQRIISLQMSVYRPKRHKFVKVNMEEGLMNRIMTATPNLEYLRLCGFGFPTPSVCHPPTQSTKRFELDHLVIHGMRRSSTLSGLLRVLSLLDLTTLDWDVGGWRYGFDTTQPFDTRYILGSIRTRKLRVAHSANYRGRNKERIPMLVDALSKTIQAGSLRELRIDLDSEDAVRSLGRFLTHAGGGLRSLHIDLNAYTHGRRPTGTPWKDPLCNTWAALNIGACASLESFRIPICLAPGIRVLQLENVALPVTSILEHVSPTLRIVTIVVGPIRRPTLLNNRSVLGLHDLDKVLVAERFPNLEAVQMQFIPDLDLKHKGNYWEDCVANFHRALPDLHARRLLRANEC